MLTWQRTSQLCAVNLQVLSRSVKTQDFDLFAWKDDIIEMATIKDTGFEGQVNASDVFGVAGS